MTCKHVEVSPNLPRIMNTEPRELPSETESWDDDQHQGFDLLYGRAGLYFGSEPLPQLVQYLRGLTWPCDTPQALDIGCGEGRDSIFLARKGYEVQSIDVSGVGLKKLRQVAKRESLGIKAVLADIRDYDFPKSAYDVVVARTILDHIEQKWHGRIIKGIVDCLKVGGIAFVECFTTDDPGASQTSGEASDCASFIRHYFKAGELRDRCQALEILEYREYRKVDKSHGRPHWHGLAVLVGGKRAPRDPEKRES